MTEWRDALEGKFGEEIFRSGFSGAVLPTGSFIVDYLTGIGGFPLGSIVELFGKEGCGKTTLALSAIKEALDAKRPILYEDYECTTSDSYLKKLGIDPAALKGYRVTPRSMEDGWMIIKWFCEQHQNGLIVVDSVAAMPPLHDIEKMKEIIGHTKVASMAGVMSVALREMVNVFKESNNCILFVNQERANVDTMQRLTGTRTTPGGFALKYYAGLRLQMQLRGGSIKVTEDDVFAGESSAVVKAVEVWVNVVKNNFGANYRRGRIYVRLDEGIDNILSAIKIGVSLGLIQERGGGRFFLDEKYSGDTLGGKKIHGLEHVRKYFLNEPESWYCYMRDLRSYLNQKLNIKERENVKRKSDSSEGESTHKK